jgi:hypothetical protein
VLTQRRQNDAHAFVNRNHAGAFAPEPPTPAEMFGVPVVVDANARTL